MQVINEFEVNDRSITIEVFHDDQEETFTKTVSLKSVTSFAESLNAFEYIDPATNETYSVPSIFKSLSYCEQLSILTKYINKHEEAESMA